MAKKQRIHFWEKYMKIMNYLKDKDERNLLINIGLAFAVKGGSLIISLFSMPLYIKYFDNNEVLGLWYTILSLLNWITICDLGLGNGLRNRLTEALALADNEKAKRYISSTYASLIAVILPVLVIGTTGACFVNWNKFFNLDEALISPRTLKLAIIILFISIPLGIKMMCWGLVIYAFCDLYIILQYTKKILPQVTIKNHLKNLFPLFIQTVLMGFGVYLFIQLFSNAWIQLLGGIATGIILYFFLSFFFTKNELLYIIKQIKLK
jgi:hypothetical protein